MADVVLAGSASQDMQSIFEWSADGFGDDVAAAYIADIQRALDLLGRYPQAGVERRDTRRPYRSLRCRSHRILYRVDGDRVRVVRILHGAQSAEGL